MLYKKPLNIALSAALALLSLNTAHATKLTLDVYNPGSSSTFAVSSELISGAKEVALIDAQFEKKDAVKLVEKINKTGKKLTTIFISHYDPDYYFGLDTLHNAFPDAKIIATKNTIKEINLTKEGKYRFWSKSLKEQAPQKLIVPEQLAGNRFTIDGQTVEIKGINGVNGDNTFLWIPSLRAVVGSAMVYGGVHLWLADAQSVESRTTWRKTLNLMTSLHPDVVVPGHYQDQPPMTLQTVTFNKNYLNDVENALKKSKSSQAFSDNLNKKYPNLKDKETLSFSAQVLMGETQWPM